MELAANLDSMTPEQLREYAGAMDKLAEYARAKALAMEYRAKRNAISAYELEAVCNAIYNELPAWARSW